MTKSYLILNFPTPEDQNGTKTARPTGQLETGSSKVADYCEEKK